MMADEIRTSCFGSSGCSVLGFDSAVDLESDIVVQRRPQRDQNLIRRWKDAVAKGTDSRDVIELSIRRSELHMLGKNYFSAKRL
jgi:hypothetical protein